MIALKIPHDIYNPKLFTKSSRVLYINPITTSKLINGQTITNDTTITIKTVIIMIVVTTVKLPETYPAVANMGS